MIQKSRIRSISIRDPDPAFPTTKIRRMKLNTSLSFSINILQSVINKIIFSKSNNNIELNLYLNIPLFLTFNLNKKK